MLSILIPSRMEVYLQKTIESVFQNAHGDIEVIALLDGYWPNPAIKEDKRLTLIHYTEPVGQRQAVNRMAAIAKGEYLMKLDAHCALSKGFDVILTKNCPDDWVVVPRKYDLEVKTWERRKNTKCDYMFLTRLDAEGGPLRAMAIKGRRTSSTPLIDDTMACQGSCFVMTRKRFEKMNGLDEAHGSFGWLGCEIACKTWLNGGSLRVNKVAWYAHWQKGVKGHRFPIKKEEINAARDYAVIKWTNYKGEHDLNWLFEKFNV